MTKRKHDSGFKKEHLENKDLDKTTGKDTPNTKQVKLDLNEMEDKWLRAAAELENYKKKWSKEKNELIIYIRVEFMKEFLPLLDHFENAMQILPEEKDDFEKGIEIIFSEVNNVFSRYGLTKIDNLVGEDFNPFEQEAIGYEENEEFSEGKVIEVLRAGYKLDELLLRPAWVKVSKGRNIEDETTDVKQDVLNGE